MKPVSLSLKIKSSAGAPSFEQTSENTITFQEKEYAFSSISYDEISQETLQSYSGSSSTLILIGPTGSGKTTSLQQILAHHLSLSDIYCTACEVNQNRSFVDLLGPSASKKYLTSVSLDGQLKKAKLNEPTVTRLITQRASGATASNPQSSRSCLIVNLYSGSHVFTVVDMMGNEKYDASTSNTFANSNVSSLTQQLLSGIQHRSHNLVTNLILRRFPSSNINFLLHLDQQGNVNLTKSSLTNIANAVSAFKTGRGSASASAASSRTLPHYAQPTVSSSSPSKRFFASRFKVTKPKKPVFGAFKALSEARFSRSSSPVKSSSSNSPRTLLYGLESENTDLRARLQKLQAQYKESVQMFQEHIQDLRGGALAEHITTLVSIKADFEQLSSQGVRQQENISSLELALRESSTSSAQKSQQLENLKAAKESEIRSLQSSLQAVKEASQQHEAELQKAQQDLRSKQAEIEQITLLQKDTEIKAADFLKERDGLAQELQHSRADFEAQLAESKAMHDKSQEAEHQLTKALQEAQGLAQKLQEENDGFEKETRSLRDQIGELESKASQVANVSEKFQRASAETESLKGQLERATQQTTDEKAKWQALRTGLERKNEELQNKLDSQASSLQELAGLRSRSEQLDKTIKSLRQAELEKIAHQSEITRLQEELRKHREPKKAYEYPELDFTNINNTFPAIEIFDDHNDMTMFRRPGGSRTPSPAKVLRESNIRSSGEFRKRPLQSPARRQSSVEGK